MAGSDDAIRDGGGEVHFRSTYIDPNDAPVDFMRAALAYWQEKCAGRFAPAWTDISLLDFPPRVIPFMNVTDIDPETLAVKYRFWGTALTESHGHDYTGQSPLDMPAQRVGSVAEGGHRRLVRERKPHVEVKEFMNTSGLLGRQILLRLPLSDDGVVVNHGVVLSYVEFLSPGKPLSAFFDEVLSKAD